MRAVGDHRAERARIEVDRAVEARTGVARQRPPVGEGALERLALRSARRRREIGEGRLVRRDQAGLGAGLDRHVADGHALVHRQAADGRAAVFDDVAGAAGDADLLDDGQHQVLGGYATAERTLDVDRQRLRLALQQALRGQHVADLGGADAEGQRTEGAVRARVAVATDDRLARARQAQFRADDVDDAAARVLQLQEFDAELRAVAFKLRHLAGGGGLADRYAAEDLRRVGRRRVVHGREGATRLADLEIALAQHRVGLRGRDLVGQVQVDVQHGRRVGRFGDDLVGRPDFLEQRAGHHALVLVMRATARGARSLARIGNLAVRPVGRRTADRGEAERA